MTGASPPTGRSTGGAPGLCVWGVRWLGLQRRWGHRAAPARSLHEGTTAVEPLGFGAEAGPTAPRRSRWEINGLRMGANYRTSRLLHVRQVTTTLLLEPFPRRRGTLRGRSGASRGMSLHIRFPGPRPPGRVEGWRERGHLCQGWFNSDSLAGNHIRRTPRPPLLSPPRRPLAGRHPWPASNARRGRR